MGFTAKSQILLNADSSQIRKEMSSRRGALHTSTTEKDIETKGYYCKMVFWFPLPMEGNSCLMNMTFYLTLNNKCFKYDETYWGRDLADQRIDEFTQPLYGMKRVTGSLKWVNAVTGFEASLIPKRMDDNKFASEYILEFKQLP